MPALGAPVVEDNAVVNGEFEIAAYPARAATCLLFGDGYINVFQPGNPYGLPWLLALSPCHTPTVTASGWTHGSGALFDNFDNSADLDREAKILPGVPDPQMGNHNMWQAYTNPHQAFTAGDKYEFRVESGTVPPSAAIMLGLSMSPLIQSPPSLTMALSFECALFFTEPMMTPDEDGTIRIETTEGNLFAMLGGCSGLAASWSSMSPDERGEKLSQLRLVQHSFLNFNTGTDAVVIDGVKMFGAATVPEAVAGL